MLVRKVKEIIKLFKAKRGRALIKVSKFKELEGKIWRFSQSPSKIRLDTKVIKFGKIEPPSDYIWDLKIINNYGKSAEKSWLESSCLKTKSSRTNCKKLTINWFES